MSELSGRPSPQPFAIYDPTLSCWRTCQWSLDSASLPELSVTWPRSGMTRSGRAFELPMSVPLTVENVSSSLLPTPLFPTPQNRDGQYGQVPSRETATRRYAVGKRNLEDGVALLPTPRATDGEKGGPNQRGSSGDLMLPSAVVRLLPTPRVAAMRTSRTAATDSRSGPSLEQAVEIANGTLPRELTSWQEAPPSWSSGAPTDPPSTGGNEPSADKHQYPLF